MRKKKREKRSPISGGHSEGDPPVPIPNTEVKPFSADNTRLETSWEDKTLPESNIQEAEKLMRLVRFLILYAGGRDKVREELGYGWAYGYIRLAGVA